MICFWSGRLKLENRKNRNSSSLKKNNKVEKHKLVFRIITSAFAKYNPKVK
jgi:hypothetical protein